MWVMQKTKLILDLLEKISETNFFPFILSLIMEKKILQQKVN